jgi:hypothetical protein
VWPSLLSQGDRAKMLLLVGVAGLALFAVGVLLGRATAIALGVFVLAGAYVTHLVLDDPPLDRRAALVAGGLLLAAELGSWSAELRRASTREAGRTLRRLAAELVLGTGGVAVSALVLAAADVARVEGIGIEAAGAVAAAALLWLAVRALSRPSAGG